MLTLVPSGSRGTYTTREDDGNTRIPSAATERYEAGRWKTDQRGRGAQRIDNIEYCFGTKATHH
jgi:hypothetical protein